MKNKINPCICKTCFNRWRSEGEDWCKIIENKGGGSILANRTECKFYLKKGNEPKWLCCKCGKNTYGESSTREAGKIYCSNCYYKKEATERKIELAKKQKQMVEEILETIDTGELLEVVKKYLR